MAEGGIKRQHVILGIMFLFVFVVLSLMVGYTLLLIALEIVSSLFVVFFVYGVLVGGIESKIEGSEEGFDEFHMERGDLRGRISAKIKRLRDRIFYRY